MYLIVILIVSSIVLGSGSLLNSASESNDEENETYPPPIGISIASTVGIPANAEEAAQQGVKGVIIIKSPDKRSEIYVPKGETRNYTIQLSYISYTNQTSTYVSVNPKGPGDVGRGGLMLSDYVTYTPMGIIEVRVKRKTNVTMTVTAPMDVDLSFPFMAPGIRSKYPIYDKTG